MQFEVLKGGWIKQGSVIAFPHQWQRPAKTEEWVYETLIDEKVDSKFVEFICFPWATLIDAIAREKSERVNALISALNELPPKKTLIRATACQHIDVKKISDLLNLVKINNLFWAHKNKNDLIMDGITLHPMALYPVAFFSRGVYPQKKFTERKYRFSFIGAYDESIYLNDDRLKIFSLSELKNSFILRRSEWHFERRVYKEDINSIGLTNEEDQTEANHMHQYKEVMNETQFALCPTGAGSNTIRLWEAFMYQSVPVIINSNLDFPNAVFERSCISLKEISLIELNNVYQEQIKPINFSVNDFLLNIIQIFDNRFLAKLLRDKR